MPWSTAWSKTPCHNLGPMSVRILFQKLQSWFSQLLKAPSLDHHYFCRLRISSIKILTFHSKIEIENFYFFRVLFCQNLCFDSTDSEMKWNPERGFRDVEQTKLLFKSFESLKALCAHYLYNRALPVGVTYFLFHLPFVSKVLLVLPNDLTVL